LRFFSVLVPVLGFWELSRTSSVYGPSKKNQKTVWSTIFPKKAKKRDWTGLLSTNVTTRWNSTYDMLEFAVDYQEAIDSITGNQKIKLRQYELSEEDWEIATKLCDVFKVSFFYFLLFSVSL
jgi:hypothetical protein